jgi:hypothetical protein
MSYRHGTAPGTSNDFDDGWRACWVRVVLDRRFSRGVLGLWVFKFVDGWGVCWVRVFFGSTLLDWGAGTLDMGFPTWTMCCDGDDDVMIQTLARCDGFSRAGRGSGLRLLSCLLVLSIGPCGRLFNTLCLAPAAGLS